MKIDRDITAYLDGLGLPYAVTPTKRHALIRINGRAVTTVSRDGGQSDRKAVTNALKQIERFLRSNQP